MIVHMGSQLDLWSLEGEGYILQKSCTLEEEVYKLGALPNSSIVWFFNNSDIVLYDLSTCRPLFTKVYERYDINAIQTTQDHVFVEAHDYNAQLFKWNGSHLKPVFTFSITCHDIRLSLNGVIAFRKRHEHGRQTFRYINTTSLYSSHSIKIPSRTGFEFGSYRLSPDGRYVVLSSQYEENVAVYNLATNRLVFNGSVEVCSDNYNIAQRKRAASFDGRRPFLHFVLEWIQKITDLTIAYIDISASPENLNSLNMTFTTIDLDVPSVFADQIDFRRINGTAYLQVVSRWGKLNFFKLKRDGQTWVPLQ